MLDFKQIEEEAKKVLKKQEIHNAVEGNDKKKPLFSFLEGPPTANAPPGLHHLEVRTYKDIINKFKFMQGFNVPRKAGWDCHGLPVEVQIEKKLNLNSKKDIVKHGELKFINECKDSVFSYIDAWNKSTERIDYWIDLKHPYVTLDNNYVESVWWSLKQLYDKNLLYEGHKVVPLCPRCETPLSSHEVAQGYKKVNEDSVIVKFRLKKEDSDLLVWTTTPWTLPSNLAIAVNPDLDYVYVKEGRHTYIVVKDLVESIFEDPKITKTIKGKELLGLEYNPLFPYFKNEKAFRIIGGDFVTTEEGTGLVHMAPAFGEIDYDACKAEGLPFVQPVDENGKFTKEVSDYEGEFVKHTDKKIIRRLEDEGTLFKTFKYEHDYPFCWRCNTPLIYYAINSWFIAVTKYKKKLIDNNKKINWVPNHIKEGRFGKWLEGVKDWALSRKKFWGTPLPVWRCDCKNEKVIGSIKELRENSLTKFNDKDVDLHKPWIDDIKFECEKCGREMSRVNDVIDCWYDSGSASFAQFHYPFENKDEFEKRFPYDFISEAIDQTRGWFYTLHVLSTILFDKPAYKNVICAGHIIDEKGEKMSKSKGNILNPDEVLDSIGVDATRMQFCVSDVGSSKRFGTNMVREEVMPFLNILGNINRYYKQILNSKKEEVMIEDKWVLSRLNSVIKEVTENLEKYQIDKALRPLMDFISNDFSRTYIKLIRDRQDKNVQKVIGTVLENAVKMLAPFAPNISEVIYKEFDKISVHFSSWPKQDAKKIDKKLEEEFALALEIIEKGLAVRDQAQIGLKWPLAKAEVKSKNKLSKELQGIVSRQLNVKKIIMEKGEVIAIKLDTKMTPELEAEGFAREISRKVQALRKNTGLVKEDSIDLVIVADEEFSKIISKGKDMIKERTSSKKVEIISDKPSKKYKAEKEEKIKGKELLLLFNKL